MSQASEAFDSDPKPWTRQRVSRFRPQPRRKFCLALADRAAFSALQELNCDWHGTNVWAMKFRLDFRCFVHHQRDFHTL
jgi:hypothetical protein